MSFISPKILTEHPIFENHMDPLSDLFGSMSIQEVTYKRLEVTAPWGFHVPGRKGPRIRFASLVRGSALLRFKNQHTISLSPGDVYIFIFNDEPYTLVDDLRSTVVDYSEVEKLAVDGVIEYGGTGSLTTFVGGSFTMNTFGIPPIFTILPRFLHLRFDQNRSKAFQSLLDLLAAETAQPGLGSSSLISRLYEALFLYAVRAYASCHAAPRKGWLAAISDKHLSKVIHAMSRGLGKDWSVESLAREARMSRSAFALRFRTVLGETPLEYLTQWRMYRAAAMIRSNNTSLSEVASAVGYGSESSFSRVFRREMGLAPREYQRRHAVLKSSKTE